jgi:hypothetical protein
MSRIAYVLLSLLILTAFAPIAPLLSNASISINGHVPTADATVDSSGGCNHGSLDSGDCRATKTPTRTAIATDEATEIVDCDGDGGTNPNDDHCTATPTHTPTATPNACQITQPTTEAADFSNIATGGSVQGLGMVAPDLNITAQGAAVKVVEGADPWAFTGDSSGTPTTGNPTGAPIKNGDIAAGGGFSNVDASANRQPQDYTFTFTPGVLVSDFSLHMLDFGDWNPSTSTLHSIGLTGYDANNVVVAQQTLSYTTPADSLPTSSDLYGNLQMSGDAMTALSGQPGNWTWHISGQGIVKISLVSDAGFDPAIAFDGLTFTANCP